MKLELNIPDDCVELLREAWGESLDRAALEALAIEGYRSGRLTLLQVGRLIGLDDRWSVNAWLAERRVWLDYTHEELKQDRAAIARLTERKQTDDA